MKAKIQVVVNCGDCDHCGVENDKPYCELTHKLIENTFGISEFCPLEWVEIGTAEAL